MLSLPRLSSASFLHSSQKNTWKTLKNFQIFKFSQRGKDAHSQPHSSFQPHRISQLVSISCSLSVLRFLFFETASSRRKSFTAHCEVSDVISKAESVQCVFALSVWGGDNIWLYLKTRTCHRSVTENDRQHLSVVWKLLQQDKQRSQRSESSPRSPSQPKPCEGHKSKPLSIHAQLWLTAVCWWTTTDGCYSVFVAQMMLQSDVNLTVTLITAAETTPNFKPVGLHRVFIHLYWFHQRRKGACICVKGDFLQEQERDLNKEKESDVISPSLNPFLSRTMKNKNIHGLSSGCVRGHQLFSETFFQLEEVKTARRWPSRSVAALLCRTYLDMCHRKSFNLEICQKLQIMMLFIQQVNWIQTFRPEFHPTSQKLVDQTVKHVSVHENK